MLEGVAPRWRKLARDLARARGRVALMVTAVAVSLVGLGVLLGAYAILAREIERSYLGTRPASATLEIEGGADAGLVAAVRRHPRVAEAEARDVVVARTKVGHDWRRTLLFVVDDFRDLRLNLFRRESGAWPPPHGAVLVERSAVQMLGAGVGGELLLKPPHGEPRRVPIAGLVHDPGLAPAWQERAGYVYLTRATLQSLGEPRVVLRELRIELRGAPRDVRAAEAGGAAVASWVAARGHAVQSLRVPPPALHPHQRQMLTMLFMMLGFAGLSLLLSAVLVASALAALLARQVREIAVMKTIGARARQIGTVYAALVAGIGGAAVVLAIPVGAAGALAFARRIAVMLNFDLASTQIPAWVFATQAAAGVLVPLAVGAVPIVRASRRTVRRALDDHGAAGERLRAWLARLPAPARSALRRPARLALTVGLLSAGGAMFMTALDMKDGWEANVAKVFETRRYDVEILLQDPEPVALAETLGGLPGVRAVEAWGQSPAAFAREGRIDVSRTYPDRGHGSFVALAPPPRTTLVRFPLLAGRWLEPGDTDAVVLNHSALAQSPALRVGSRVRLSLDGAPSDWTVVGVVEEIGAAGVAYVPAASFARATRTEGRARLLRVATDAETPAGRTDRIRALERALAERHVAVEASLPLGELRTTVGDHVLILVRSLIAMAVILALVGALGLASTMGIGVVERTAELGVMKTLGATPRRIRRMLLAEGLTIGIASFAPAFALSLPLTAWVDGLVGRLGFLAPLPFVVSPLGAAAWLALSVLTATVATLLPGRRAAALVVKYALAHT